MIGPRGRLTRCAGESVEPREQRTTPRERRSFSAGEPKLDQSGVGLGSWDRLPTRSRPSRHAGPRRSLQGQVALLYTLHYFILYTVLPYTAGPPRAPRLLVSRHAALEWVR